MSYFSYVKLSLVRKETAVGDVSVFCVLLWTFREKNSLVMSRINFRVNSDLRAHSKFRETKCGSCVMPATYRVQNCASWNDCIKGRTVIGKERKTQCSRCRRANTRNFSILCAIKSEWISPSGNAQFRFASSAVLLSSANLAIVPFVRPGVRERKRKREERKSAGL